MDNFSSIVRTTQQYSKKILFVQEEGRAEPSNIFERRAMRGIEVFLSPQHLGIKGIFMGPECHAF